MNATTDSNDTRIAQHIADRTARLLEQHGLIPEQRRGPLFQAWMMQDRLILMFDPLAGSNIDQVLTQKFSHRLSTALAGRRVVATNSRGLFLQVSYWPTPAETELTPAPLDLAQQPGPVHVPLGMTAKGPLWLALTDLDAVLIGGSRRMGKTRLLHSWVQALSHGGQAQLVLWDGKRGVEFGRYAGAPGVTVVAELAEGLMLMTAEMARREGLFKAAGVTALPEYAARTGQALPLLVLIVDEAAFIPEAAQPAIADLVARGGAFGVHPVLATQRPDAQAVQSLVKTNLSTRIALPVPAVHDSQVILGHPGAEKLPKIKGRLLFTWEGRLVEAQAFMVELPIEAIGAPAEMLTATERRLATAAIKEMDGVFHINRLAEATGESRDYVNELAQQWEQRGLLTPIQRNEKGHLIGRLATETLIRLIRA